MVAEPIPMIGEERATYTVRQPDSSTPRTPIPIFSCSTGLANTVQERLSEIRIGEARKNFLERMHRESFGRAGQQRERGEEDPGLFALFDLAQWASWLHTDRSNVR